MRSLVPISDRRASAVHASGGDRSAPAQPDARNGLLALQRAAGNRATACLLRQARGEQPAPDAPAAQGAAPRRGHPQATRALQRSCLDPAPGLRWDAPDAGDVYSQWHMDSWIAASVVQAGLANIAPHIERAVNSGDFADSLSHAGSPPHSPPGTPSQDVTESPRSPPGSPLPTNWAAMPDRTAPIEDARPASSSPRLSFKLMPKRRLQRAMAVGSIVPSPTPPPAPLALPPMNVKVDPWTPTGYAPGKAAGYKLAHNEPLYQLGPMQTASAAKLVRRVSQAGSGVGPTRPLDWWYFLALVGPYARMKWVQGHFINRRLGGHGAHENLAPFTYSMNSVHYHQVEKPVLQYLQTWGPNAHVSYTVRAEQNPVGSVNEQSSVLWHKAFLAADRPAAIAAMAQWGIVGNPEAAALILQGPLHHNWGAVTALAEKKIRTYVQAAFPAGIVCRARYYGFGPLGLDKHVGQVVIDNTP
jgi:hypothetical protein